MKEQNLDNSCMIRENENRNEHFQVTLIILAFTRGFSELL